MTASRASVSSKPPPPPHIRVEAERLARHLAWPLPWPAPCLHCSGTFAQHEPDCSLGAEAMRTFREEVNYLDAHPSETSRRRPMTEAEVRIYYGELGLSLPEPPDGFVYEMSGELIVTAQPDGWATADCLDVHLALKSYRYSYEFLTPPARA